MKTLSILALAATVLGVALPNGSPPTTDCEPKPTPKPTPTDIVLTRSFTLPDPPFQTYWRREASAEADAEAALKEKAQRTAEEYAAKRRDLETRDGPVAFGNGAPAPGTVQITGFTYAGTGCPQGTIAYAISADQTTLTILMDSYVASIGGKAPITESRKNCQLNLNLLYPSGFQYSIFAADYRGYAYLDPGVTGTQKSTYYFSGQTAQTNTGTSWKGPFQGDYLLSDQAKSTSVVFSPCGANALLNINSQLQLASTNSTGQGLLTTDSIDTSFTNVVYLQWQACKK